MATQLTVANTLDIAAASLYLSQKERLKYPLAFNKANKNLPEQIYIERESVLWGYEQNVDGEQLRKAANYLYTLCGRFGLLAQDLIGQGGGFVEVGGVTKEEEDSFPLYITQADFTTSNFYPNVVLANYSIRVYLNEINRLLTDSEFSVNAFGLTILLDGFDATLYTYELMIYKVN